MGYNLPNAIENSVFSFNFVRNSVFDRYFTAEVPVKKLDSHSFVRSMNKTQTSTNESRRKDNARQLLPSPLDRPNAEVIIYDGNCNFCKQQVANLNWFDRQGHLAFVSLHDPFVKSSYPDLTHEKMMEQMYLITRDHQRLGGAAAIKYLTTKLPTLWILAPLLHIPFSLPLWQYLYSQVASYRYLILGKTDCQEGCEVHFKK